MADTNREIELKLDLGSEENYRKLCDHFTTVIDVKEQKNYFFDSTERLFYQNGWALRLRIVDKKATLAAKGKAIRKEGGVVVRPETEQPVARAWAYLVIHRGRFYFEILPLDIKNTMGFRIDGTLLKMFASFQTKRTVVPFQCKGAALNLEIDRVEFADGSIEYELEVEFGDDQPIETASEEIKKLLDRLKIPVVYQNQSKLARAMNRIETEKA
jgi:uncharacterized protein YjbK